MSIVIQWLCFVAVAVNATLYTTSSDPRPVGVAIDWAVTGALFAFAVALTVANQDRKS